MKSAGSTLVRQSSWELRHRSAIDEAILGGYRQRTKNFEPKLRERLEYLEIIHDLSGDDFEPIAPPQLKAGESTNQYYSVTKITPPQPKAGESTNQYDSAQNVVDPLIAPSLQPKAGDEKMTVDALITFGQNVGTSDGRRVSGPARR